MKNLINWKKGLFSCYFKISSGKKMIGILRDNALSRYSKGELNGLAYSFVTKGLFKKRTELVDHSSNEVVANISFNCWTPGAAINYKGQSLSWNFKNMFETSWQIFDSRETKVRSSGNSFSGQIEMSNSDERLALIGLYISNYYWQIIWFIIAVLGPSSLVIFI